MDRTAARIMTRRAAFAAAVVAAIVAAHALLGRGGDDSSADSAGGIGERALVNDDGAAVIRAAEAALRAIPNGISSDDSLPALGALAFELDDLAQLAQLATPLAAGTPKEKTPARAGASLAKRQEPLQVDGKLSENGIEECLAVARDIDPNLATQLEKVREMRPELFGATIQRSRRLIALAELKRREPVLYDLKIHEIRVDAQVSHLAAQVRRAETEGRHSDARALREQLRMQVIAQLGFRYRSRDDYLCRIREEVERLEKELHWERDHFVQVLGNRMNELVGAPPPEAGTTAEPEPRPGT